MQILHFMTAYVERDCGRMVGENTELTNIFHLLLLYLHFSLILANLGSKYVRDYIITL